MNLSAATFGVLAQAEQDNELTLLQRTENLTCGGTADTFDGNAVCRAVFQWTENTTLANLAGTTIPPTLRIIIILFLAWLVNRVLKRLIKRFVRSLAEQGLQRLASRRRNGGGGLLSDTQPVDISRATMRTETVGAVLRSLTTFVIFVLAGLMILGTIGLNLGPLIAGAGIAGVALGFGAQSLVKDFLSGIFMIMEDQFGVGDIVDVGEATGIVESITLRSTRIRAVSGTLWHVPNGEIRRVGNMSQLWSRALLDIGVAYATDVDHASSVMKRVADEMAAEEDWEPFFVEPAEVWGVHDLAENEVTIRMVAKVTPAKQWPIERELRGRIKAAFDAEGIEIPFPQRTLWVRQDPPTRRKDGGSEATSGASEEPEGSRQVPRTSEFT
jgi:moderate conductance mechanosensitive channel